MSEKRMPLSAKASREATDWLILLQEDPNDADVLSRFDDWLRESPENATAWVATQHASDLISATPPAHAERWRQFVDESRRAVNNARAAHPLATSGKAAWPRMGRRRSRQLAAVAVAACLALLFAPDAVVHLQADYTTGTAEMRTVRLKDGSTAVLAPESAIAIAYNDSERSIRLLAGEAFFEVSPDPGRPLRVTAREVQATVLGTAFNVRRSDDGASIAVQHGLVRVDYATVSPHVSETLGTGQSVQVTWSGKVLPSSNPINQVAAWRRGQLIAQDEPMGDVVGQLRRYYHGTIILAAGTLAHRPVTGVYNLSDPVDALRAVARAHGAAVRQVTPWVLLVTGS